MSVKPFIKWAGGKSQLLPEIRQKYPNQLGASITKYCEPFIGGGAVFFDILSNYSIDEILINDINPELTNTYIQIKTNVNELISLLSSMQEEFWKLDTEQRKEKFYIQRDRFNYLKVYGDETNYIEKAAIFIFLNKTCFNGLYRVNRSGLFNVPIGSYKKPLICDINNLNKINALLSNVTITCGDYKNCIDFIDENTFVYIDPPYRPLTETASFNSYSETNFNDGEQIELKKFVDSITKKQATVILSNSDPKNVNADDSFFDELYSEYKINRVSAKRMINSVSAKRGNINELLITNF